MSGDGAARWSDEVVEAAAEAMWRDDPLRRLNHDHTQWLNLSMGERTRFRIMARAALGVIPPDPVVAAIRDIAAEWDQRGATWCMTRIARLLADGAGT